MKDVGVCCSNFKQEPEDVMVHRALLQPHVVVLLCLVIPVHSAHVPIVQAIAAEQGMVAVVLFFC